MKQQIHEPNEKELAWIQAQLTFAASFVSAFASGENDLSPSLAMLDKSFANWMETKPTERNLINEIINGVGITFGNHLVDKLGMKWVIAIDEYGSDLAVYGLPGKGDVLVYPANFVAKRWERSEINFLESSFARIQNDIRELEKSHKSPRNI